MNDVGDAQMGLRIAHVARMLTPALMQAEGSGAAIAQAVVALRAARINCDP
jgi:hypothetical protein